MRCPKCGSKVYELIHRLRPDDFRCDDCGVVVDESEIKWLRSRYDVMLGGFEDFLNLMGDKLNEANAGLQDEPEPWDINDVFVVTPGGVAELGETFNRREGEACFTALITN